MMKVLTQIGKKELKREADAIFASIPGYELSLSSYDSPYDYIFITDDGCLCHIELDRGEHFEEFQGKTYREAVKGIAKSYIHEYKSACSLLYILILSSFLPHPSHQYQNLLCNSRLDGEVG